MNIDSSHLFALLDPLGFDDPMNLSFVRIAYRVTMMIFIVETVVEILFPLLVIVQLLR